MKVALVSAEMSPYAKVGGLADVMGALPAALQGCGAAVSVVMPGYRSVLANLPTEPIGGSFAVSLGPREEHFTVRTGIGPAGVPLYFIEHEGYFGRAQIYGEGGQDYPDNAARFIFFSRAAAGALAALIKPELVHAHDWHSALVPIVMRADPLLRPIFERTAAVFTIHNLAFQGLIPAADFPQLGLPAAYLSTACLEFWGSINLMKGAVMLADITTTVSPNYAREVTTDPESSFGLEGVLRSRGERFIGILNGADYHEWDPAKDPHIAAHYSGEDLSGKRACRADLRRRLELPAGSERAMVGMVSRMVAQKGFDLLAEALDPMLAMPLDLVVLGNGEPALEARFIAAQRRHPDRVRINTGFSPELAHQIQAGADLFLMPSRFEPCGLTQMYALKYATVPVVRATGGLADTVHEFNPATGAGNGVVFEGYTTAELLGAMRRALALYEHPPLWRRLMANCAAAEFSWPAAARQYHALYRRLIAERGMAPPAPGPE